MANIEKNVTRPPQVLRLHTTMVKELGKIFSLKSIEWRTILNQVTMLNLLPNPPVDGMKTMENLFSSLVQKKDNNITYGEYTGIRDVLGSLNVSAEEIIDEYTGRIQEFYEGKRKQRRNSDSESETEEYKSKGKKGKHKISRESDSEAEDEKRKPTRRRGHLKHSRDFGSETEDDGSESNRKQENAGKLRKLYDNTHNARIVKTWQTAMSAVGFIQGPVFSGTGFRVGEDRILTAYHVVEDLIKINKDAKPDLSNLGKDKVFITFNFLEDNNSNTQKFYFKESLFHNKEMDFAILQLRNKDNTEESSFPKAIRHFKPVYPEQTFALLGHPDRKPMQLDPKVHIFDPKSDQGKRRLEDMNKWGRKKGKRSAYENILDENKVLFDCWVQHGASGSPGIEMGSDGEPVCSLMLIRGYPDFVFDDKYKRKEEDHPYMIEQGVTMQAIAATLNRMGSEAKAIMREIFADNYFEY